MHVGAQPPPRIVVRDADTGAADGGVHEHLRSQYEALGEDTFVCVGDVIPTDMQDGFLRCDTPQAQGYGIPWHARNGHAAGPRRGHGTQVVAGQLMATVCGRVERVNKLVSVRPLRSRCAAARAHCHRQVEAAAQLTRPLSSAAAQVLCRARRRGCGPRHGRAACRPNRLRHCPADASRASLHKRCRSSRAAEAPRGSLCLMQGLPRHALCRHGGKAGPARPPRARAAGRRQALGGRPECAAGGHAAAVLGQPARWRAGARPPRRALAGRAHSSRGRGPVRLHVAPPLSDSASLTERLRAPAAVSHAARGERSRGMGGAAARRAPERCGAARSGGGQPRTSSTCAACSRRAT